MSNTECWGSSVIERNTSGRKDSSSYKRFEFAEFTDDICRRGQAYVPRSLLVGGMCLELEDGVAGADLL